jgi:hypothetical protein
MPATAGHAPAVQYDGLDDGAHLRRQPGQRLADLAVLHRQQHLVLRGRRGPGVLEHGSDAAAGPQAEGAHVAVGDSGKQRLVARAAVHDLLSRPRAGKVSPRGGKFPPGLPRPRDRTQPGQGRGRRTANGPRVLLYRYLTWREGRERLARRRCLARRRSRNPGDCIPRDLNPMCPTGVLNTETREISPDRGNHAIEVTRAGRTHPGIPQRRESTGHRIGCATWS